jgi:hypothetical protein
MTITTGSFSKFLWPGVDSAYGTAYNERPTEYTEIYETRNSTMAYEEIVGIQGFGLAPVKTEGAAITFEDTGQAFIDRFTHITYGLGFTITREMFEDGRGPTEGVKRASALGMSIRQTQETVAANVLNRAFSDSYTFGDGLELCSDAHLNYSGGTWRNELATASDLNETSLEQAFTDIDTQLKTDKGLQISVIPKKLIIPPQLRFEAIRLLRNPNRPATADRDINAIYSEGSIPFTINHYLTDTDAWFITTDCKDGMIYWNKRAPEFGQENTWDTENMRCKATVRFSVGCGDKRGIFGSPGAA